MRKKEKMRNLKNWMFILMACLAGCMAGCGKDDPPDASVTGNDQVFFLTFELLRIDSAWYWGDSEKIRLQSGVIMLNPDNHTYFRRFYGTADQSLDPAQAKWSKEESGKYLFTVDSARVFFSNDPDPLFYFPGYFDNGKYHQPRLEQYDSVWYSIIYFSMAVSGRYVYSLKPG